MRLHSVILSFLAIAVGGLRADEVCTTPGCLKIAKVFKDSMDLSVDPCDDFYQYTCGNFIKKAIIPDWEEEVNTCSSVEDNIRQQLKHELKAKTISGQPPSFQKAKDYYRSCIDTENLEKNSIIKMKERLDRYGSWPVLVDNWNEDDFEWIDTTMTMLEDGQPGDEIIAVGLSFLDVAQTNWAIFVGRRNHYLDDDTLKEGLDNTIVQKYLETLVNFAVAFGADREQAEQDMTDVVQLEIGMVNLTYAPVELPKMPKTISELENLWPYFPWMDVIKENFLFDIGISGNTPVEIDAPHYLTNLENMLPTIPKRTLANYIMCQVVFDARYYLSQEMFDIGWSLENVYNGGSISIGLPPRSEYCIEDMLDKMGVTLAAMYVRKYVSPDIKKEAEKIVDMLQDQFVEIIANEDWLTDETKTRSMNKIKNIKDDIAYPEELLDDDIVNEYHEGLNITSSNYYDNHLAILNWDLYLVAKSLQSPGEVRTGWQFLPFDQIMTMQCDYLPDSNSLVLYAGQLQRLFFSPDRPTYVNLGLMGAMAAQQLPSAFDIMAREFDEDGNHMVWDRASEEEYDRRAIALANEYSTYTVKEVNMTLDGDFFVDTVVGDQGGYKIARMTLDTWQSQSGKKEPKLKGLEKYSEAQIFWLGVALNWCSKTRLEWIRWTMQNQFSLPSEMRVNCPLRQSEQFAQDWECPVGSYMNPKDKFNVW